jgi:hypothetical protein
VSERGLTEADLSYLAAGWRRQLRREVWELGTLERDFAPDYDRTGRFGRPPTRDMLIAAARERHPEVFAVRAGAG